MSSQLNMKYSFDNFYDDTSEEEESFEEDSGAEEEKLVSHNDYETPSSNNVTDGKTSSNVLTNRSYALTKTDSNRTYTNFTSSVTLFQPVKSKWKKQKKGKRKASLGKAKVSGRRTPNVILKKVLSINQKKTYELRNVIYELRKEVEGLTMDNRSLQRDSHLHNRDIRELKTTEDLMRTHSDELRVIKEKYKGERAKSQNLAKNLQKIDQDLLQTKDKYKKLDTIVNEKKLGERVELENKILNLEDVIQKKDSKISTLNRNLDLQRKAVNKIVKEKNEKFNRVFEKMKILEDTKKDLISKLQVTEKKLAVTNIYSRYALMGGEDINLLLKKDSVTIIRKKLQKRKLKSKSKSMNREMVGKKPFISNPFIGKIDTMVSKKDYIHEPKEECQIQKPNAFVPPVRNILNGNNVLQEATSSDCSQDTTSNEKHSLPKGGVNTIANKNDDKVERSETENIFQIDSCKKEKQNVELISSAEEKLEKVPDSVDRTKENKGNVYARNCNTDIENFEEELDLEKRDNIDKYHVKEDKVLDQTTNTTQKLELKINEEISVEKEYNVGNSHIKGNEVVEQITKTAPRMDAEDETKSTLENDKFEKRKLLLAKIKAIDDGKNPNDVTVSKIKLDQEDEKNIEDIPDESASSFKKRIETHCPRTMKTKRSSWEFKKTDENLHNGLPAYADTQGSSTHLLTSRTNNIFDRKSRHSLTSCLSSSISENMSKASSTDVILNARYSPTLLDDDMLQNKKTVKKKDIDLFDQFENPFTSLSRSKKDVQRKVQQDSTNESEYNRHRKFKNEEALSLEIRNSRPCNKISEALNEEDELEEVRV